MFSLLKKEINTFLCHPSGLIILFSYLTINSIILWLFPGSYNIIESEYAQLDGLFIISPVLFMVFIPALTMRLFSDEFKDGTIETLLTKPLSNFQIVFSKYLSGIILVCLAILPTIIYYISIYQLSEITGNVDKGGILGSYLGLFFLASSFVSIGTFASSLSNNQIITLILSILISAFIYQGFDLIASLFSNGQINLLIDYLGINHHYNSISKGIIDSRDIIYFISINALFILLTINRIDNKKEKGHE
jgi:ABC-2 type transport system permease protein